MIQLIFNSYVLIHFIIFVVSPNVNGFVDVSLLNISFALKFQLENFVKCKQLIFYSHTLLCHGAVLVSQVGTVLGLWAGPAESHSFADTVVQFRVCNSKNYSQPHQNVLSTLYAFWAQEIFKQPFISFMPGRRFLQKAFGSPGVFSPCSCLCTLVAYHMQAESVNTSAHYCNHRCFLSHYRTPGSNTSQASQHIFKATLFLMSLFHTLPLCPTRCSQDVLSLSE